MKRNTIGFCPICNNKLIVSELKCMTCQTTIKGEFEMSPFDYLTPEQKNFAILFILYEGNIKEIEKILNISYPTVKKNIEELKKSLGINYIKNDDLRDDVKRRLKNGEIDFEEAERILGDEL